jgi:hypothetical protein
MQHNKDLSLGAHAVGLTLNQVCIYDIVIPLKRILVGKKQRNGTETNFLRFGIQCDKVTRAHEFADKLDVTAYLRNAFGMDR